MDNPALESRWLFDGGQAKGLCLGHKGSKLSAFLQCEFRLLRLEGNDYKLGIAHRKRLLRLNQASFLQKPI